MRVFTRRELGDGTAFCEACAWRKIYRTRAEADVAEDDHDLLHCPFRKTLDIDQAAYAAECVPEDPRMTAIRRRG